VETEIIVALIGSCTTIAAAGIGAFSAIRKDMSAAAAAAPEGATPEKFTLRKYWKETGIIGVGLLLAVVVLVVGYAAGRSADKRRAELERQVEIGRQVKSYSSLLADGLTKQRRYVIPAAVMLVTLELSPDGKSINSDRHIIYELQGLSDISKDPARNEDAFVEQYHSHYDLDQVPGADPEHIQENKPSMKQWNVWFDLAQGERHAVVTGVHANMPLIVSAPHTEHMFDELGATEDAFCYPNTDGDVIEEFVIVIQSGSLELYLPNDGDDDAVLQHGLQKSSVTANMFISKAGPHPYRSVVGRFRNLQKGDVVGLRVGWKVIGN
jgi:hypothetical protein